MTQQTIAISGASGQLGRRVIELLLQANVGRIVAATRTPEKISDLAVTGVDVRQADFGDSESLAKAFAGVDRLLIISTDSLDRRAQHQIAAVEAATQAGVKHIVYTSILHAESGLPPAIAPSHYATEQVLAQSPLSWTVLRNSLYTDSFLQSLPYAVATGQLMAATGNAGVGYVTREDCARAAAATLASSEALRKTLDITGPAILTGTDLAKALSDVVGKSIEYVPITLKQKKAGLVASGLPEFVAELITSFDDAVAQGLLSVQSNTVTELTGRSAISVKDFLAAKRAVLMAQ
jgi:NAD(P)H dehydrogenase (quinone)